MRGVRRNRREPVLTWDGMAPAKGDLFVKRRDAPTSRPPGRCSRHGSRAPCWGARDDRAGSPRIPVRAVHRAGCDGRGADRRGA